QPRLDVLGPERLPEERIVVEVDLPDREIVGRAPPGVHPAEKIFRQRLFLHGPTSRRVDRAIWSSSSVRTTRTWKRAPSVEITDSLLELRRDSRSTPRNPSSEQMEERIEDEFSPMPPEKARTSMPPSAAAQAPMALRTW